MPFAMQFLVAALFSYLVGSIPFSLMLAKWFGKIDLRTVGSGNVGATNVARAMGAKWGLIALFLDALKGALPTLLIPSLFKLDPNEFVSLQVVCGVAAILGHMFPPWLGFKGGKGVATGLGVATILSPWGTLAIYATLLIIIPTTQLVSLASMLSAVAFGATTVILVLSQDDPPGATALILFATVMPVLIIYMHRANIKRLLKGEEPKLKTKAQKLQARQEADSNSNSSTGASNQ